MRRITIFERDGAWRFQRTDGGEVANKSVLTAALAAMQHAESLRGESIGYIIRLQPPVRGGDESIVLHTELF